MRHGSPPPPAESDGSLEKTSHEEVDCIDCMAMPERPRPPPADLPPMAGSQYHHQASSGDDGGHVFISNSYQEQVGNAQLQTPPAHDPGSQPLGLNAPADDQHRVTLFITHYPPPPPPPPPSWPQDIWLENHTCRVLYQPVLVLPHPNSNPQPCQGPAPPLQSEQAYSLQTRPAPEPPMRNGYQDQANDAVKAPGAPPTPLTEAQRPFTDNAVVPVFAHPQMNADLGRLRSMSQEPPVGSQWE